MYPEIEMNGWHIKGDISALSGREMVIVKPLVGTEGREAHIRLVEDCKVSGYAHRDLTRERKIPQSVLDFIHANWDNFTNIRGTLNPTSYLAGIFAPSHELDGDTLLKVAENGS